MADRWVIDADHPAGHAVPFTDAEAQAFEASRVDAHRDHEKERVAAAAADEARARLKVALDELEAVGHQDPAVALLLRMVDDVARLLTRD